MDAPKRLASQTFGTEQHTIYWVLTQHPMRASVFLPSLAVLFAAGPDVAESQESRGATVTGIVTDSARVPLEGADVFLRPSGRRVRTDSTGRYFLSGLDKGGYQVTARKLGYQAMQVDMSLSKNGRLEQNFILAATVTRLDTIRVSASGKCEGFSVLGFECRKKIADNRGGLFLDYPDIDAKDQRLTADLFRSIPGFRVQLRSSRAGVEPVIVPSKGYGCIAEYVDGRPRSAANPVPQRSIDLVALEVYSRADSVPIADTRYIWKAHEVTMSGRCVVVFYWTVWAPIG